MVNDNEFEKMFDEFQKLFPLDFIFDRMASKAQPLPRLEIYKFRELVRIANALEAIAEKLGSK